MNRRSDWAAILRDLGTELRLMQTTPVGMKGLGVIDADRELWRIGGAWLAAHSRARVDGDRVSDVYVATNVHKGGGHTALIGDFVRALSDETGPEPKLIVTNTGGAGSALVDADAQTRTGVSAASTVLLRGPSLLDRLDQLFDTLLELRPRRLFLFHHPDDPLPVVAARPEIARQRVIAHHADARVSFGLHVPGMQLVDLNPIAAATSRLQGLAPALLRLTSPDPGRRPVGFLRRQQLVTATCGPLSKVSQPHFYGYPDTVAVVLRTTGGWHVHIGELDGPALRAISAALQRSGVSTDRFIHVPWTPSVAATLWEHDCDLYLSTFPIDGARTNIDVMASGTPHLRYASRPDADGISEIAAAGGVAWHTWEDLEATLRSLADCAALEQRSRLIRVAYEAKHHPTVFAACLRQILSGGAGAEDPHREEQDLRALRSLAKASASIVLNRTQIADGKSARAKLIRWLLRI